MAVYLNTSYSYKDFKILTNDEFFVDKSNIIAQINRNINTKNRYLCITKPRRFGKTSVLNMLGAYYGRAYDTKTIFDNLNISKNKNYAVHLNQYNIINIALNNLPESGNSYENYINFIKDSLKEDIKEAYPQLKGKDFRSIPELLNATNDEFIFMIDEWDYIFSHELYTENQGDFLEFLRDLLKDRHVCLCVKLANGMTAIRQMTENESIIHALSYVR